MEKVTTAFTQRSKFISMIRQTKSVNKRSKESKTFNIFRQQRDGEVHSLKLRDCTYNLCPNATRSTRKNRDLQQLLPEEAAILQHNIESVGFILSSQAFSTIFFQSLNHNISKVSVPNSSSFHGVLPERVVAAKLLLDASKLFSTFGCLL